jgi:SAM-dependent methyltransferase
MSSRDPSPEAVENRLERVVEGFSPQRLVEEHRQRYRFALRSIASRDRVVDCACGSGYGARLLAGRAASVVGIDRSLLAVAFCRRHHALPNAAYVAASAEELPLAAASADVFVAFETIEHLLAPERFLDEALRVIKPGGLFLVSTPNRLARGAPSGGLPANPHHVREWSLRDLDGGLAPRFADIEYFAQRIRDSSRLSLHYWRSKWRRLLGRLDITPLPRRAPLLDLLERGARWQPQYFIARCRTPR